MAQPLNILCFGDSLTEGFSMFGSKMTPYSKWMKEVLDVEFGGEYEVTVVTMGSSGECVCGPGGFEARMSYEYSEQNKNQDPYDWVVFLGGTNDLGWGKQLDEIWETILRVTDLPLGEGARLLLMTVPECRPKFRVIDEKRAHLNARIRGDQRENVYIFDLNKKITYHGMKAEEREEIWDDGLHLSEKGYERMGRMVGERLVGILNGVEGRIERGMEQEAENTGKENVGEGRGEGDVKEEKRVLSAERVEAYDDDYSY